MKLRTVKNTALSIAAFSICYILTTIPLLNVATHSDSVFEPIPQNCVPTIKREISPYYLGDSGTTSKIQQDQTSVKTLMNQLVKYTKINQTKDTTLNITSDEAQALMHIGQSEAEIDGVEGMAAVMKVVLNRVKSPLFPNSVFDVINQHTTLPDGRVIYQFSPVDIGSYYNVELSVEAHIALAEIEKGAYDYIEALYFENAKSSWQEQNCEYLYTIGHHKFYK